MHKLPTLNVHHIERIFKPTNHTFPPGPPRPLDEALVWMISRGTRSLRQLRRSSYVRLVATIQHHIKGDELGELIEQRMRVLALIGRIYEGRPGRWYLVGDKVDK